MRMRKITLDAEQIQQLILIQKQTSVGGQSLACTFAANINANNSHSPHSITTRDLTTS